MANVVLIDRQTGDVIQTVKTDRVQWTIDQLMRNRDPRLFIAKKIVDND